MNLITKILGIKYPIVQAPMSWLTDARFVAAVSNAGGMGVIGPNPDLAKVGMNPTEATQHMDSVIKKVKKLTNKPFGINLVLSGKDDLENPFLTSLIKVAFENKVKYFFLVDGLNKKVFDLIKKHNGIVIYRPLTPSIELAKKAQTAGVDILVATGFDEGGDLPNDYWGTFTVVPAIVDAVDIPVLAAGGIVDKRGVRAAMELGAEGVYMGTRFLVTQESPMAETIKQAIVEATHDDLVVLSATRRSLKTPFALKLAQKYQKDKNTKEINNEIKKNGGLRPGMLEGNLEKGVVSINSGIDGIIDIPSVGELITSLIS